MNYLIQMTIDLKKRYEQPLTMPDVLMVPGENAAHVWEITVLDGKQPADLTGYTATARFERADGFMREVSGTVSGSIASVTFDGPVYSVPGLLRGQFFVSKGTQVIALVEAFFEVRPDINGDTVLTVEDVLYYADEGRISYGGMSFYDVSGVTATETDVRDGKTFVRADGTLTEGNASFDATITGGTVTATLISGDDYELTIS